MMKKKVLLAVLLSFIIPGLGQVYNEDHTKGAVILVGSLASFFVFGPVYLALWLWGIVDAYVRARALDAAGAPS